MIKAARSNIDNLSVVKRLVESIIPIDDSNCRGLDTGKDTDGKLECGAGEGRTLLLWEVTPDKILSQYSYDGLHGRTGTGRDCGKEWNKDKYY